VGLVVNAMTDLARNSTMIHCPKCKANGDNITIREFWTGHSIEFEQNPDGTIKAEGYLCEGNPVSLQGECLNCRNKWRMRGKTQITNLKVYRVGGM
jgi:hypothetical protein